MRTFHIGARSLGVVDQLLLCSISKLSKLIQYLNSCRLHFFQFVAQLKYSISRNLIYKTCPFFSNTLSIYEIITVYVMKFSYVEQIAAYNIGSITKCMEAGQATWKYNHIISNIVEVILWAR